MKETKKTIKDTHHMFLEFMNIKDLVNYIENTPTNNVFRDEHLHSKGNSWEDKRFTGTNDYEEALNFLIHGWDEKSKEIEKTLKLKKVAAIAPRRKQVNSMVGYQASVPRYLMGMPDSMIDIRKVSHPTKIITVNKLISVTWQVRIEDILESSIETARVVNRLEQMGYRVKLNVIAGAHESVYSSNEFSYKAITASVTIKKPNEKFNVSKMAFPLVHPSMLRRIIFRLREVYPDTPRDFLGSYGRSIKYSEQVEMLKHFQDDKNVITLPSLLPEGFRAEDISDLDTISSINFKVSGR